MPDTPSSPVLAKVVGAVGAIAAGWIATQIVNQTWKAARGHKPPRAEDPGDSALTEIILAAAFTGAVVGVARAFAARGAARLSTPSR